MSFFVLVYVCVWCVALQRYPLEHEKQSCPNNPHDRATQQTTTDATREPK